MKILTVREVAAWLKVHQSTLYKLARRGCIPAFRMGSDFRFDAQMLETWMAEQTDQLLRERRRLAGYVLEDKRPRHS